MNDQEQKPEGYKILKHMLRYGLWGMFIGPFACLILGLFTGGLISVGFGLAGLFYYPLFGGVLGGLLGIMIGFFSNREMIDAWIDEQIKD